MVIRGPCLTSPSHTAAWPSEPQTSHGWRCPALGICPRAAQPSWDRGWSPCPFEPPNPSFKPSGCHQVSHDLPTSGEDVLWEVRAVGAVKASNSTGIGFGTLSLDPGHPAARSQVLNPQSSIPSASTSWGSALHCCSAGTSSTESKEAKGAEREAAVELGQGHKLTSVLQYRLY